MAVIRHWPRNIRIVSEQSPAPSMPSVARLEIDCRTKTDWSMIRSSFTGRLSSPSISGSRSRSWSMTRSVLAPFCRITGMYTCLRPLTRTMVVWIIASSVGSATSPTKARLPCSVRSGISAIRGTSLNSALLSRK